MKIVIRVGEGQSPSGKILGCGTHWYVCDENSDEREDAIIYALNTNRNMYISINNKRYIKTNPEKLRQLTIKKK